MNCREFWKTVSQDRAPSGERSVHLDECPRCRTAWNGERRLVEAVRAVGEELRREEAPPRVESRLLSAMRAQAGLHMLPKRPAWMRAVAWVSAAAAVAALAVFLVRDRQPEPVRPARPRPMELAMAGPQAAEIEMVSYGFGDDFIMLPNAVELDPSEEANMVRVELSRSTMVAMGFPVSAESDDTESIAADVMLGPDGLARAVRFLDE